MSRRHARRPRVGSLSLGMVRPAGVPRRLSPRVVEDLTSRGPSIEWAPLLLLGSMILLASFLLWWMVTP